MYNKMCSLHTETQILDTTQQSTKCDTHFDVQYYYTVCHEKLIVVYSLYKNNTKHKIPC